MNDLLRATETAIASEVKTLRFSRHWVPTTKCRTIGQIMTSSIDVVEFFRQCWNHRVEIAALIRRSLDDGK